MATVIFDFDSTLINCESLECILAQKCAGRPELTQRLNALTNAGMEGQISFIESLQERLKLAQPTREDVTAFGQHAIDMMTSGMKELVLELKGRGVDIWILSGAFRDAILPLGRFLGIDDHRIHAVRIPWDPSGAFNGLDREDPFTQSKLAGARTLASQWQKPTVVIGDGMTDYMLMKKGLASEFIAFTEHVARGTVVASATLLAHDVDSLRSQLDALL